MSASVLSYLGIDLIAAFYGCLYAGCVPITVRPPHPQNIATTLPTVKMIVEVTLPGCTSFPSARTPVQGLTHQIPVQAPPCQDPSAGTSRSEILGLGWLQG